MLGFWFLVVGCGEEASGLQATGEMKKDCELRGMKAGKKIGQDRTMGGPRANFRHGSLHVLRRDVKGCRHLASYCRVQSRLEA